MNGELNELVNLVFERTGLVPEVETTEELVGALLEWGEDLAKQNQCLVQAANSQKKADENSRAASDIC